MENLDGALLNTVQTSYPIQSDPYATLADLVGTNTDEAFERMENMRQNGIIRRLGGVFDSRRLGYFSTLCAAKVPEDKISALTEALARHPGVTHNYLRNHEYNMWFTLISPSEAEVENHLELLRSKFGIRDIYSLPALRFFKIKVEFNFNSGEEQSKPASKPAQKKMVSGSPINLSEQDKALVRVLQGDLPHSRSPFAEIGQELGWSETEVLKRTQQMLDEGAIRRFGAVLRHQKAGFTANAMGVWLVPEAQVEGVGKLMAEFSQVSHCYQRPSLPDWPYNVFTMIHGKSTEDCERTMEDISAQTGIKNYSMLFSIKELKKCSMNYFMEDTWTL